MEKELTMISSSEEILATLEQTINREIQQRHSFFQLKYFLIGQEPTNQAKMWQCLRELKTRKETIDSINLEIEESIDNIESMDISIKKIDIDISKLKDDEYKELLNKELIIKAKKIKRKIKSLKNKIEQIKEKKKWVEQECIFFIQTFKNLNQEEPLKNFDDLECQKQYWENKLSRLVNLKLLAPNNLDSEIINTIISLPDDINIKANVLNIINQRKEIMIKNLDLKEKNDSK